MKKTIILFSIFLLNRAEVYTQKITNIEFEKVKTNLRAKYFDQRASERYGCDDNLECTGPYLYITNGFFKKNEKKLELEGYLYTDANNTDTIGMEQFVIFTAIPHKKYLRNKKELINTVQYASSGINKIIDKKTGYFRLTTYLTRKTRLYIDGGKNYFFQEFWISCFLKKSNNL